MLKNIFYKNLIMYKIWIDEAGRWPWAWWVVACAFCFNPENMPDKKFLKQIWDSKKISEKKRKILFQQLVEMSSPPLTPPPSGEGNLEPQIFFWVWVVDNFVIDEKNIKQANKEAMRRALVELLRKISPLSQPFPQREKGAKKYKWNISWVFIDWNDNYNFEELDKKPVFVIKWDEKILEIGAASIIAKVFRDKLMNTYSLLYPNFWFENHKWYWTKKHREKLLEKKDITWIHRISYKPVKKILEKKEKLLLHICCWPDASIPIMDLKEKYDIICFWYDPNIQPKKEYEKRFKNFVKVCKIEKVPYIKWEYDVENFLAEIKWLEKTPEKWEKCTKCYDFRLKRTALEANKLWIKYWTTTLNISPHKDLEKIFEIGEKYSNNPPLKSLSPESSLPCREKGATKIKKEKLEFLKIAFRKNGGFERSVEYTKKHKIYRQNYCGCIYSDTFPEKNKFEK